jgi:chromosome segregation ATPase
MTRKQQRETQMPPTSMATLEEINANADREINRLDRKEIQLNQEIAAAQQELAEIPQTRQERAATLQARRRDVERLTSQHDQDVSYARLSHQTEREAFAVRSVGESQKQLEAAKQLLAEVERTVTQADQAATKREKELRDSLQRWQAELEVTRRECAATEAAREKARTELGRQKCDEAKATLKTKYLDPIRSLEKQRVALMVEKQRYIEKKQEELLAGDWYQFYDELVDAEHDEG